MTSRDITITQSYIYIYVLYIDSMHMRSSELFHKMQSHSELETGIVKCKDIVRDSVTSNLLSANGYRPASVVAQSLCEVIKARAVLRVLGPALSDEGRQLGHLGHVVGQGGAVGIPAPCHHLLHQTCNGGQLATNNIIDNMEGV